MKHKYLIIAVALLATMLSSCSMVELCFETEKTLMNTTIKKVVQIIE